MAQENTARVITIAATEQPQDIRLRVAAYARVSSSSDEQLNSFAAQNRYYTELISGKDNWQLVDIYADEGITGTSIEKRDDFKRMLRDCERGLIDRILVKSISRFARNTTECLETVRSLKARGISVYFEKEGIDTGKVSGEMLTAVFASLAQAESESISKNMRWSYQKRMQMGTFIPTHLPYGYCRFDCKIAIVDAEAEIVKRIFNEYLMGKNMEQIAASLNTDGIPFNNRGALQSWSKYTVGHILENEKYIGDSLWQKTYYTSTLPRYQKKNLGEMPQYYAQNTHPAIIDSETYAAVQKLRSSKTDNRQVMCPEKQYMFNGKLIISEHQVFSSYGKAWYGCFYFAASNCGTMLALLPVFDRVKNRKRLTATILAGFLLNIVMFSMVIFAVLNSMPGVTEAQVPYLYVIQTLGVPGLVNIYSVILAAAVITTGITLLYTYTIRFRKYVKVKSDRISAFIILTAFEIVGAVISKFGLITLVSKGFSLTVWINIVILIIGVPIMYFIRTHQASRQH